MKKMNTKFGTNGIETMMELFNTILEKSGYNLNKYINGKSLSVSDNDRMLVGNDIKKFVTDIPEQLKKIENKKSFWDSFSELDDYCNINKFLEWVQEYAESILQPYEDATFLREMEQEKFEEQSKYCLENLILKNNGVNKKYKDTNNEELLKKILLTFIDMVIVNNYSKDFTLKHMKKMFGIEESYCTIWWDMVQEKEDKLWKIMLMKKCDRIDRRLEYLLDKLEE